MLQLLPHSTCLSAEGRVADDLIASRVVSLGSQSLSTLLAEELRIRSRDVAFERALERALDPVLVSPGVTSTRASSTVAGGSASVHPEPRIRGPAFAPTRDGAASQRIADERIALW